MHKLILSIIAVAFLQIGFITYITSDKTADNTKLTGIQTKPVDPVWNQNYVPDDGGIEVASLNEDPFFRRETGNFGNTTTSRFEKTNYTVRRTSKRVARKSHVQSTPFVAEDVIITYAVQKPYKFVDREPYRNVSVYNEPVVNRSETQEQPLIKSEKSDGNLILNVIKKPYGWIKALGSKLK